jgi:hypothetical protein
VKGINVPVQLAEPEKTDGFSVFPGFSVGGLTFVPSTIVDVS